MRYLNFPGITMGFLSGCSAEELAYAMERLRILLSMRPRALKCLSNADGEYTRRCGHEASRYSASLQ